MGHAVIALLKVQFFNSDSMEVPNILILNQIITLNHLLSRQCMSISYQNLKHLLTTYCFTGVTISRFLNGHI